MRIRTRKTEAAIGLPFPGFIFKTDQSPVIYLILAQKKPPRCISAGGGSVLIAQRVYARVFILISIMNQTDGVPEVLVVVVRGVHIVVRDAHTVRHTRVIVRTCPVADVLIDVENISAIAAAGSR